MKSLPYWRLSSFYFFYFAALGVLVPFWSLYLKDLGFDAIAIGELVAIPMATKFIAPYLWGALGDRLNQRMAIVRLGAFITVLVFVLVFWLRDFWELVLAMALFSFFWNAVLPQFEVVTLRYLGKEVNRYAQIRVWGSLGFIVTVIVLGIAVDNLGPSIVPTSLLLLYFGIWMASLMVKDKAAESQFIEQPPIGEVLRRPAIIAFFLACFLMQAGHGAYYAFYSIYMEAEGYSKTLIGQLWALGVLAEVIVFVFMHRLLKRFGGRQVLLVSLVLAAIRWLLIGNFPQVLAVMFLAQILHAASFGTFHAAAIHLVHHYFTGRHQGRGQALYSSLSFGAGGALGSVTSGFLWDATGAAITFGVSTALSLCAAFVVWRWIDKAHDY